MKIALKFTDSKFELPQVIGVCHDFSSNLFPGNDCNCPVNPRPTDTLGIITIPFGKYKLSNEPVTCNETLPRAQVSQPQQIRDLYRQQCCPQCN